MIDCPKCGKKVGEYLSECKYCGEKLVFKCQKCGNRYYYSERRCSNCGYSEIVFKDEDIFGIKNIINDIEMKLKEITIIQRLTIKIANGNENELVKQQESVIEYLNIYYNKYCLLLFKYNINKEFRLARNDHENVDVHNLYSNLTEKIQSYYKEILKKEYFSSIDILNIEFEKYNIILNEYILKFLIDNTQKVITSISPINDKFSVLPETESIQNLISDKEQLNKDYDIFMAELEISLM